MTIRDLLPGRSGRVPETPTAAEPVERDPADRAGEILRYIGIGLLLAAAAADAWSETAFRWRSRVAAAERRALRRSNPRGEGLASLGVALLEASSATSSSSPRH